MNPKWVKVIRTAIQCSIALISVLPLAIPALGLSATVGLGAAVLGISTSLSRVMQLPAVETLLQKWNLSPSLSQSDQLQ